MRYTNLLTTLLLSVFLSTPAWAVGILTQAAGTASSVDGSGGGGVSGWPTSSTTKEITWANSIANAARIGDGTTPGCFFTDATLGFLGIPCTASNTLTMVLTNFTWSLWDQEAAKAFMIADPDSIGAGSGTLTMQTSEQFVASNLGIEFTESDTNPTCSANNYNIYADTSEATLKQCRNGLSVPLVTSGFVRKTSDTVINNDNTVNSDPALLFAVDANSFYRFTLFLKYSASTAADLRIVFSIPASSTGHRVDRYPNSAITACAAGNNAQHNVVALDTQNSSIGGAGVAAVCVAVIDAQITTAGTAGNVTLQWAQSALDATDATVYADSYIEWRKL